MTMKAKVQKEFQPGQGYSKEDWDAVDSPPLTEAELANMRPAREMLPPAMFRALAKASLRARGRPKVEAPKVAITLRLDPDVLETFKAKGRNWRKVMAEELKKAAGL